MNTKLDYPFPVGLYQPSKRYASPKQVELLVKFGVGRDTAKTMTLKAASEALEGFFRKDKQGILEAGKTISIDLRSYAATYTTLSGEPSGEMFGPCPKCGGTDRFHCKADWWFCRVCYPVNNDQPHDAIGFVMWLNNCNYRGAIELLTGGKYSTPSPVQPSKPRREKREQTDKWRIDAAKIVDRSHKRLLDFKDKEAQAGRDYLENVRKLEPETWIAYKLGYTSLAPLPGAWDKESERWVYPKQPAIVIPWIDDNRVVAIRYRFLRTHTYKGANGDERSEKMTYKTGSVREILFGGQALEGNNPEDCTVLCIEGESNAMAARQVSLGTNLDVLSVGSQDFKFTDAILDRLKSYRTIIFWMDEDYRLQKVLDTLPDVHCIKSNVDGTKYDANNLLINGVLPGVLALHRLRACRDDRDKQRLLLSDLVKGAIGWFGCDSAVAHVITQLSKQLGVNVAISEVRPGVYRTEPLAL